MNWSSIFSLYEGVAGGLEPYSLTPLVMLRLTNKLTGRYSESYYIYLQKQHDIYTSLYQAIDHINIDSKTSNR